MHCRGDKSAAAICAVVGSFGFEADCIFHAWICYYWYAAILSGTSSFDGDDGKNGQTDGRIAESLETKPGKTIKVCYPQCPLVLLPSNR
jgi:hypothetical protein